MRNDAQTVHSDSCSHVFVFPWLRFLSRIHVRTRARVEIAEMVFASLSAGTFRCFSNDEVLHQVDRTGCDIYIKRFKEEENNRCAEWNFNGRRPTPVEESASRPSA